MKPCKKCGVADRSGKWAEFCKPCAKENRLVGIAAWAKTFPKPQPNKVCAHCHATYHTYNHKRRKYCSYKCHLDSGGAFRAGLASSEATMKYGPKKDANHNEVVEEMRKHCPVYDLSTHGRGLPDGLAWIKDRWELFDVKNPKTGYGRRGLNDIQKKWIAQWQGGPVYLIYTVEEAARFGQGKFDGIKKVESGWTGGGLVMVESAEHALRVIR